jgi:hypothetical protein
MRYGYAVDSGWEVGLNMGKKSLKQITDKAVFINK